MANFVDITKFFVDKQIFILRVHALQKFLHDPQSVMQFISK